MKKKKNTFKILDGQQRITTLFILAIVLYEEASQCNDLLCRLYKEEINKLLSNGLSTHSLDWTKNLVIDQPQTIKQVQNIYTELRVRYKELITEGFNNDLLYKDILHKDLSRFEAILKNGQFSITILDSTEAAEQFFQGENNRGMAMGMLDLLKSYHMRFESNKKKLDCIDKIWDEFNIDESLNEAETTNIQKKQESEKKNRIKRRNRQLVEEYVIPALLMHKGVKLWDKNNPNNIDKLKGLIGTNERNRLVDEKLKQSNQTSENKIFDLLDPISPGLGFFLAIKQYLKITQAIDEIVNNWTSSDRKHFQDKDFLLKMFLICWVDRFLINRSIKRDHQYIKDTLIADSEFKYYYLLVNRFLNRLTNSDNGVGVYSYVKRARLDWILQYHLRNSNLLLLPYKCSSPEICRRNFIKETSPKIIGVRFSGNESKYKEVVENEIKVALNDK